MHAALEEPGAHLRSRSWPAVRRNGRERTLDPRPVLALKLSTTMTNLLEPYIRMACAGRRTYGKIEATGATPHLLIDEVEGDLVDEANAGSVCAPLRQSHR